MKTFSLFILMFVFIILVTNTLSQTKTTESKENDKQIRLTEKHQQFLKPENELIDSRDRSSQHYKINDSTNIAILHSVPIFYSANGVLEKISNNIVKNSDRFLKDGYSYKNERNSIQFYFNNNFTKCLLVKNESKFGSLYS